MFSAVRGIVGVLSAHFKLQDSMEGHWGAQAAMMTLSGSNRDYCALRIVSPVPIGAGNVQETLLASGGDDGTLWTHKRC